MKIQIVISVLLVYSTLGACAQNTEVKIDLPKRDGNLKHWPTYPPEIQIVPTAPTIRVFTEDAEPELYIQLPPNRAKQAKKTVLTVPASELQRLNSGNLPTAKIGNFTSNYSTSYNQKPNLPSGATSHILPCTNQNQIGLKPPHKHLQTPKYLFDAGPLPQRGASNTVLKYTPTESSHAQTICAEARSTVKTSVTGVPFNRGELINAR